MSFDVDTSALATFAKALETNRAATAAAITYLDAHSEVDEVGTVWADAYTASEQFVATLRSALSHLESIFKVSEGEINKVAALYQHRDKTSAAQLDSSYPKK